MTWIAWDWDEDMNKVMCVEAHLKGAVTSDY